MGVPRSVRRRYRLAALDAVPRRVHNRTLLPRVIGRDPRRVILPDEAVVLGLPARLVEEGIQVNRLARYHLVWALVLLVITLVVAIVAGVHWFKQGRPPVWHFWAEQMIVVAGAYRFWYHAQAFNKARKQHA